MSIPGRVARGTTVSDSEPVAQPARAAAPVASQGLLDLQRTVGNRTVVTLLAEGAATRSGDRVVDRAERELPAIAGRDPSHAAPLLNRRVASRTFAVGPDIFLRRSAPVVTTVASERIQRHASWEHKMLGDVDPAELEVIASARDLVAERKNATQNKRPEKTITTEDGKVLDPETVMHAIEQEITRLQVFAKDPPKVASQKEERQLSSDDLKRRGGDENAKEDDDVSVPAKKWEVRLVAITLSDKTKAVLTYGEVNTLADFFGSTDQIRQTDPKQFRSYVAGIREESIRKFMRLHTEVATGLGVRTKYNADSDDNKVTLDGNRSMGNTGTGGSVVVGTMAGGDAYGELKMMGKVPQANTSELEETRAELPGKSETSYTAGLGRNACHFAPQSWHAWAEAHQKAVARAEQAFRLRDDVINEQAPYRDDPTEPDPTMTLRWETDNARADELQNEALFENGFGDHFLQDSFAAGHLINKTLIMQWFAQWNDENSMKRNYTSDEKWRRVQNIAYNQPDIAGKGLYTAPIGSTQSNDAQSVENQAGTWQDRFDALGLRVPTTLTDPTSDTSRLFVWWQQTASMDPAKAKSDVATMATTGPIKNRRALETALQGLIDDGVVYYDNYGTGDRQKGSKAIGLSSFFGAKNLWLKKEYVPKKRTDFSQMPDQEYDDKAEAVTYGDYHTFLNHGYLQLSSNCLHDYFCKNGLWVSTDSGVLGYKIYGDNNMLQTESAKMVKWSGETSHMSRDSILDLANQWRRPPTRRA